MGLRDQLDAKIKRNVKWGVVGAGLLGWLFILMAAPGFAILLAIIGAIILGATFLYIEGGDIKDKYDDLKRVMGNYENAAPTEKASYQRRNMRVVQIQLEEIKEWAAKRVWRRWLYDWVEKTSGFTEEWRRQHFPEHYK